MPLRVLLLSLLCGLQAMGAILQVPATHPTIQGAVDAAASGDTIRVAPGTYFERLLIPDMSLTLCSDDFFTGDSAAINTTILDGEWLGTLIDLYSTGSNVLRVESMTLQRGMGQPFPSFTNAGVFQMQPMTNLTIQHIIFNLNRSHTGNCILRGNRLNQPVGRVIMEDIMLHVDALDDDDIDTHTQFRISRAQFASLNRFRHTSYDAPVMFFSISADTTIVDDVQIHDQEVNGTGVHFEALRWIQVRDLRVWNCHSVESTIVSISAWNTNPLDPDPHLQLTNFSIENCTIQAAWGHSFTQLMVDLLSSGTMDMNQVSIRNCLTNTTEIAWITGRGWLRHLLVENNIAGADPGDFESNCTLGCFGRIVEVSRCSVEDLIVQNNVSNIYQYTAPDGSLRESKSGALALGLGAGDLRAETTYRNIIIQDNLVNDHEDNWDTRLPKWANTGRALEMGFATGEIPVLLENVIIRNNRQPNSIPERPNDDPELDSRLVGSTIELSPGWQEFNYLTLRNVLIEDNDDGGLFAIYPFCRLTAENVVSRNNGRMGLVFTADSLILKNVLVTGTDSWAAYYTYPYSFLRPTHQVALGLHLNTLRSPPYTDISNITLYDNDTECVFWTDAMDIPDYQRLELRNSILWDNDCEWFVNPVNNLNLYESPLFRYCMLDAFEPGEGNMAGVDPWFDEELGAPWLSPISPAIDAGDPNPALNDREDPDNPGFALWPSQGTLRNDIGYTGGPHLFAIDTSWVALQRPKPRPVTQPQGFSLKPAYPNPFNPSTNLSFVLDRQLPIKLAVYNLLGQEVRTLIHELKVAGTYTLPFNAANLASGVYLIRLEAGGYTETQKVLLLK